MNTYLSRVAAAVAGIALWVSVGVLPAVAHHSFAMYDQTVERTVTGKLVRFVIGSNHSQFIFNLVDEAGEELVGEDGKPVQWGVETGPAVSLARQGITVDSFPIDSIFTVKLNPLRNGRPFGAMQGLIICGMSMPEGGCTAETGTEY